MPASSSVSPAAEHRETIASASRAAAAGGVTSIIMMPDTDPIDDVALVEFVKLRRDAAAVNVHPAAAIRKGLRGDDQSVCCAMPVLLPSRKAGRQSPIPSSCGALTSRARLNAVIACETRDPFAIHPDLA